MAWTARGFPTPRWPWTIRSKVKRHGMQQDKFPDHWVTRVLSLILLQSSARKTARSVWRIWRRAPTPSVSARSSCFLSPSRWRLLPTRRSFPTSSQPGGSRLWHTPFKSNIKSNLIFRWIWCLLFFPSFHTGSVFAARSPSAVSPRAWSSRAATRWPWSTKTRRKPPARPSSPTLRGPSVSRPNQETTVFRWRAGMSELDGTGFHQKEAHNKKEAQLLNDYRKYSNADFSV